MRAVFGRVETIDVDGIALSILLVKNPAGANEVLRTLRLEAERDDGSTPWLALNDRIADGRDVSWIWDADYELLAEHAGRITCTGTRASRGAPPQVRGLDTGRDRVVEDIEAAMDRALAAAEGRAGRLFALPTYTALIELRTLLARRGHVAEFWR